MERLFESTLALMLAERFVRVLDALITGLLFTYFQTPELITEDVFVAAFEALA